MTSRVRRVEVELLRRGPRHNQLLSPLTDYLAVCGDHAGGVVHVPWEHEEVLHLLEDLRYRVSSADPTRRAHHVLDRTGAGLASMLGDVPGLEGALSGRIEGEPELVHLRLIESAAELAILPFELTKLPSASGTVAEHSLGLLPDRRVCITRRVRGVRPAVTWPTTPRILVVSGDDVPFAEHLDAFGRVLEPWRADALAPVPDRPRHWTSEQLTVIERATLDEIRTAVLERHHSHVHVLAHGAELDGDRSGRHGIALGGGEVTRGRDLALALAPAGRDLPAVVTLATCDSGAHDAVMTPGGSVAHELHAAGIPLVVASQFPISQTASVPFTEVFYRGQLAGEHPLVSLSEMRRQLATRFPDEHAWASVVVYESLPDDFDDRLDELLYWQTRRAHESALTRLERLAGSDDARASAFAATGAPFPADFRSPTDDEHESSVDAVIRASSRLPTSGPYAAECAGLRAAGFKRTAEVAYWLAEAPDTTTERRHQLLESCVVGLESALDHYSDGLRMLLSTSHDGPQRKVTTHWIAGQVMLMQAILGSDIDPDLRGVARWSARLDLDHVDPVVRAWAIVSHIELALLDLAIAGPDAATAGRTLQHAHELLRVVGDDAEHVATTHRQMRRFVTWWGDDRFVDALGALGLARPVGWSGDHGVIATASAVAAVLAPTRHRTRATRVRDRDAGPGATTRARAPAERARAVAERTGVFTVDMLPARNGDCLFVTYGTDDDLHHVLIDCGSPAVTEVAAEHVRAAGRVELFVLTHIDADHISGAIDLFADRDLAARFGDVWFNGWNQLRGFLSVKQGDAFSDLLDRDDRPFTWNGSARADDPPPPIVTDGDDHPEVELAGGLRLTVLSPTQGALGKLARHWYAALGELDPRRAMLGRRARPVPPARPADLDLEMLAASGPTRDSSVPNLSSIAVLAEYGGRSVLLTGDAHADVLTSSIDALQRRRGRHGEPLRLDALKLSHHGSANATTRELLAAIECSDYLVSTDGSGFYHPDREAIARVIVHGGDTPTIHFNARSDLNELWGDPDLQARYRYTTVYPDGEDGLRVAL